ncbi:MAG: hypothetical protein O2897_00525 [bacterium]|nr:hypothetical protein [bacterium]
MVMSESDEMPVKARTTLWLYFIFLVIFLYVSIAGLTGYFKSTVEDELFLKVGSIQPKNLMQLRSYEQQVLSGEVSLVEGKKSISIEHAMNDMINKNQ